MTCLKKPTAAWASLVVLASIILLCGRAGASEHPWPQAPQRSGGFLPPPTTIAAAAQMGGMYIPHVEGLSASRSALLEWNLLWNFALLKNLGLFAQHNVARMWSAGSSLIMMGHEAGLRYLVQPRMTVEGAYLIHRVDRGWADDVEYRPGGVIDNGGELGSWFHFAPLASIQIDLHLLTRIFEVYTNLQGVLGAGLRASLSPRDGHNLILDVHLLRVDRTAPREGVEKVTYNTIGEITWQSQIVQHMGISVGVQFSTDMLSGVVPMLELKRSMVNEPIMTASLGAFFVI